MTRKQRPWLLLLLTVFLFLTVLVTIRELWMDFHFHQILSLTSRTDRCKLEETGNAALLLPEAIFDLEYHPDQVEEHIREFCYHSQNVLCRDLKDRNHTAQQLLRVRY